MKTGILGQDFRKSVFFYRIRNCKNFSDLNIIKKEFKDLISNRDIILEGIKENEYAFLVSSDSLLNDKSFVLQAIRMNSKVLEYINLDKQKSTKKKSPVFTNSVDQLAREKVKKMIEMKGSTNFNTVKEIKNLKRKHCPKKKVVKVKENQKEKKLKNLNEKLQRQNKELKEEVTKNKESFLVLKEELIKKNLSNLRNKYEKLEKENSLYKELFFSQLVFNENESKIREFLKPIKEKTKKKQVNYGQIDYATIYDLDFLETRKKELKEEVIKIKERIKKLKNSRNCCICYENKADHILNPCSHTLCGECSRKVEKCPKCRKTIESYSRFYD